MEKPHTKFSDLTKEEKFEHILTYYKFHIFGVIAVILVVGWMLNHYIINPPPSTGLDISIFTSDYNVGDTQKWGESLTAVVIEEGVNEEVFVEYYYSGEIEDAQTEMANQAKLAAKIQMNEMDICIFEGESYLEFYHEGVLRTLDDLTEELNISEKLLLQNNEILAEYPDLKNSEEFQMEGSLDNIILIDVTDNAKIKDIIITDKPIYVSVFINALRIEEIEKWLAYIIE